MNIIYIMNTEFYTQLLPFFAYDGRGSQFVNLNYKGIDYQSSINNSKYPDTIRGEPLFQLMISENYNTIVANQQSNDIHYEFTDFIIRTAIAHRNIDVPTSANKNIIVNKYKFNQTLLNNNNIFYKNILNKIVGFLSYIVTFFDTHSKSVLYTDDAQKIFSDLIELNGGVPTIFKEVTLELIKNGYVFGQQPYIIANDITFYKNRIIPALSNAIILTIKNLYLENKNIIVTDLENQTIFNRVKNILVENLTTEINKALDNLQSPALNTLFNPHVTADKVKDVFNNVYTVWGSLENDIRKFYISFLMLMNKGPGGNWLILNNFDKFGKNYNDYRINFKKSKLNKNRTIFSETLPFLPSVTEKLWFTDSNNKVKSIDLSKLSDDDKKSLLKIVYDGIYNTGKYFDLNVNGKLTTFEINPVITTPKARFDLKYEKFIGNIIKNYMKFQTVPIDYRDDFDDLYVDLTTNLVFNKDTIGLYQMVNGSKVYQDDAKLQTDLTSNCYGTYLKDDNDCPIVFKCILNNNPQNLVRCLDSLREETLFDVARSDINNINPKIMRNIIKTFGFSVRRETDGIYRPQTFNEWMNSTNISGSIKTLVQTNKKLGIYLGEILNIIRKNPIILDENVAEQQKDYSNMNLNVFSQPMILERPTLSQNVYRDLLTRTNIPNKIKIPFFVNLGNVGFQSGGSHDSISKEQSERIADKLKRTFNSLFQELVSAGKELKDEDKMRIENAIDTYSKLEIQINRLYEEIQMYANMHKMMLDTNVVEQTDIGEIHDFNNNKQKINDAYKKIQNKINKNMITQQTVLNALYYAQLPMIQMLGF